MIPAFYAKMACSQIRRVAPLLHCLEKRIFSSVVVTLEINK